MPLLHRLALAVAVVVVAAVTAYAVLRAAVPLAPAAEAVLVEAGTTPPPSPSQSPSPSSSTSASPAGSGRTTTPAPRGRPVAGVLLVKELLPGPTLLAAGDAGSRVRELQARLRQIAWLSDPPTGSFGEVTQAAVAGFQAKREIPVTGEVDQRTLDRLLAMTLEPSEAELSGEAEDTATNTPGALDPRCETGRVLCIDKTSSTLRWVVDGEVLRTLDTRFGASYTPTREGQFSVESKSRDHVSSLFDSPMPFAMFFSGGQAVHYSSDFAARGYAGASHGCVNIRDYDGLAALYDEVQVGDAVVVYWS